MTSNDFEKIFFNGCTITPLIQNSLDKVDGFRLKVRQIQRGTRDSQKFSNKCKVKDFLWDVTTQVWHTNYGKRKCIPFIVKLINKLVILNTNIRKEAEFPSCSTFNSSSSGYMSLNTFPNSPQSFIEQRSSMNLNVE